jgi:hypothetical protein
MGEKMIYSPDHKFLLIKNAKVGGTSVEVELSKVLPDNAIVTDITPLNPEHRPRNNADFYNHIPLSEVMNYLDLSGARSYVIVRNPYDMVLSHFFHTLHYMNLDWNKLTKIEQMSLVHRYFKNDDELSMLKSTKNLYLSDDNEIMVNDFIRYENGLESELNPILKSHGIKQFSLNTFEKAYRPSKLKPKDVFLDNHFYEIQKEWAWEFENLRYNI